MLPRRELAVDIGEDDVIEFTYNIYTDRFVDIRHFFSIWPGTNDNYYHFAPREQTPATIVRTAGLWRIVTCDAATNNAVHVVIPPEVYKDVVRKLVDENENMVAIGNHALVHLDDVGDLFSSPPSPSAPPPPSSAALPDADVLPAPAKKTKLESAPAPPAIEISISHEDADGRFFKKTRADMHGRRVAVCFHCENAPPSRWREMYTHFNFDFVCFECAQRYDRV